MFDSIIGDAVNGVKGAVAGAASSAMSAVSSRLGAAGLFPGGASTGKKGNPTVNIQAQGKTSKSTDWRVKIGLPVNFPSAIFNQVGDASTVQSVQQILTRTNGVVFPYTPSITVTHNARYQEQALTHSNYKNYFYEGSDVGEISITGDFTVQNIDEGQYLLAAIYFFRSCTKMFFGADELAGNPPPIVFLDGYGDFYFPHVSCVVKSFSHVLPPDVDYLEIPSGDQGRVIGDPNNNIMNATVRLPTSSQLTVVVQPVYSRNNVYNNFSLSQFGQGKLLGTRTNNSDIAGFL